jgi:uncharacterized protein
MAQNPVRWFEIHVQDMGRAKKFYEAVFKVKLQRLNGSGPAMWAFPTQMGQMGTSGMLVKTDGTASGGNSVIIYFGCADCAVEEARAAKHGGRIQQAKMPIGEYGYCSLVYDTEGNLIGLHSMQ